MSRLPFLNNRIKICIVCEGNEEFEYLKKLKSFDVWSSKYDIVLDNAKGCGNIPAIYQDKYQNGSYELVLIFCDTDRKPYHTYNDIKTKINEFHGVDDAANSVIMYGNPCTMQIIIQHYKEINLSSPAKPVNAPLIEEWTGISKYKARADQIEVLVTHITKDNYSDMLERVKRLADDDTIKNSSNFGRFIEYFTSDDIEWIDEINDVLEG